MKLICMRRPLPLHPESFVESDGVDHQGIPLPVTDGVSVVTGSDVLWMRSAIHINGVESLRASLVDHVDSWQVRQINKLDPARRDELPGPAGGLAPGVRLEQIGFAISVESPCPGLKGNLALLRFARKRRSGESAS